MKEKFEVCPNLACKDPQVAVFRLPTWGRSWRERHKDGLDRARPAGAGLKLANHQGVVSMDTNLSPIAIEAKDNH
jgi:hypothetical protein